MRISQRNLILGLVLVGAGSLWLGGSLLHSVEVKAGPAPGKVDERRTLPAAGLTEVDVRTVSADIVWHVAKDQEFVAHLHGPAGASRPELIVSQQGERAVVEVRHRPQIGIPDFSPGRLVLDVYAPERNWRSVRLRTVSGHGELPVVSAKDFSFHSTSGDLRAAGLATTRAEVRTTSGDAEVGGFRGDLDFSSTSGDLQVQYAAFDQSQAKLTATSGELDLDLPDGAQFALDARSVSGDIRCDFPVTISGGTGGPGSRRLNGSVGGGTNTVQARTVSGDIRLH